MSGSTSYRVTASIDVRGNAAQALAALGRALGSLDAKIAQTQRNLNALASATAGSAHSFALFARGVALSSQGMSSLRASATAASSAVQGASRAVNTNSAAYTRNASAAGRLAQSAQQAAAAMRSLSAVPAPARIPPPPRQPRQATGGAPGTVPPGGTPAAGGTRGRGRGAHISHGDAYEAAHTARLGAHAVGEVFEAAAGVENQRARLLIGGTTSGTVADAPRVGVEEANAMVARAREIAMAVPGTTIEQNVAMMGELRSVLGDVHEAMDFAQPLAQIGRMVHLLTGRDTEGIGFNLMKVLERQGAIMTRDPATGEAHVDRGKMDEVLRLISQGIAGTHGRVDDRQLINFMQTGALPAAMLTPQGFLGNVFPMALAMGGHQGGTAMQAMMRAWTGSQITKPAMEASANLGIIDRSKVTVEKGGKVNLGPGAVRGLDEMQGDNVRWVAEFLNPLLKSKGIDPLNPANRGQLVQTLTRMTGNQVHARALAEFSMEAPRMLREREQWMRTPQDMPGTIMRASPTQAVEGVTSAWNTFLATLGGPELGTAITAMNNLTSGLNAVSKWASDHPEAAGNLTLFAAGLTAVAATGAVIAGASVTFGAFAGVLGILAGAVSVPAFLAGGALVGLTLGIGALGARLAGYSWPELFGALTGGLERFRQAVTGQMPAPPGGSVADVDAARSEIWSRFKGLFGSGPSEGAVEGTLDRLRRPFRGLWDSPTPAAPGGLTPNPGATTPAPFWANPPNSGGGVQLNDFRPAPATGGDVVVQTAVNLDGRTIADVVTRHQGRAVNAPQASTSFADRRRGGLAADVVTA